MSVARRAHAYPNVRVDAAGLVDVAVAPASPTIAVGAALRLARTRAAGAIVAGERWVLREDLARAAALGLGDLPAAELARALPVVDARADEVAVRRALADGAPMVAVRDRRGPVGAVARPAAARRPEPVASAAARVARHVPADALRLLAEAARLAGAHGASAFAVGGLVRDVWREAPGARRDLDLVVEGDGAAVARALAAALGGRLVEHARFLTASIDAPGFGRVDVTTSRTERYEAPGALPRVLPAGIGQDLARRDFTVNAMALELASGTFGLLDPWGGRLDLARRRLRVLHPLSYVEDPTRVFRAARYAARLGLTPDRATRAALALALRLLPYPALSGQRLAAELERMLAEPCASSALTSLGRAGAFRLLASGYRFTAAARRRVGELPAALAWARGRGLAVDQVGLATLALVGGQRPAVAAAALARVSPPGEPRDRLERALDASRTLAARLGAAATPSARARHLRGLAPVELAWHWLAGDQAVRATLDWFTGVAGGPAALTGGDVIALGVPRGPAVARVLAAVRDARLDGTITTRAMEEEHVRHWLAKGG
ncbi:MAG: hypothetical protein HYU26_02590 [Candidatus Rokubacteria bacterium]|nr:hypothetical protein [Candidatus Rokubacteria bacterium]